MTRGTSIFNLLGGVILISCIVISATLVLIQYRYAEQQSSRERESAFDANHALLQLVFEARLDQLTQHLRHVILQEELDFSDVEHPPASTIHHRLSLLEEQGQTRLFDRLILTSTDGSECHDHGDNFFRSNCQQVMAQLTPSIYRWHLYKSPGTEEQVGLLRREPVINAVNGQVIGYLYAGMVLSDNFALLNRSNSALGDTGTVLALALDGQVLASNVRLNPAQTAAILAALDQPGRSAHSGELVARSDNLRIDHESGRLQAVTVMRNEPYQQFGKHMAKEALSVAALGIMLAVLLSMVAVKLTLQPLLALLHFIRDGDSPSSPPKPGAVREINQISHYIATHVSELHASQRVLKRYSEELETAHCEVQHSNRDLHQRSQELARANQQLEELMAQNKSLLHQLFHLQEEERKHLAQELHDELGQTLAAVSTEAHLIRSLVPDGSHAQISADTIYQRAQQMYEVVYNRMTSLRPLPLNDLGLTEAIRHMPYVDQLERQGCHVSLDLPPLPRLQEKLEINLFRVVQESLANTLKHAAATQVAVSVQFNDGCLQLLVRDNGHGFTPHKVREQAGFGIGGMHERCHAVNGTLHIESGASGTSVLAEVPIETVPSLT